MSIRRYHDMKLVITDIDRRQCHRIVPMKVLVLGLGRTGTDCRQAPLPAARIAITLRLVSPKLTPVP